MIGKKEGAAEEKAKRHLAAPMAPAVQARLLIVAMLERERAATIARSISLCPRTPEPERLAA